jgi:hypothetical protein
MWWMAILSDFLLLAVGACIGFVVCSFLVNGRDADRQAELLRMMDDARRDA